MSKVVCGLLTIDLRLAENYSLKGKRQITKSLRDRLRKNYNVSVAELNPLDDWHRAVLAVTTINKEKKVVESVLTKALNFVENTHLAEICDSYLEIF